MIAIRNLLIPGLMAAALVMAGCDEIATGEKVQTLPVSENDAGGYGPLTLTLTPDMAPVAINFRAQHGDDPAELGKWNAYRATLSKDGREIAAGQFNINQTGSPDVPAGAPYLIRNMLTAQPAESGDYELSITPTKSVEVKLTDTQVEVRRNVRSGDTLR